MPRLLTVPECVVELYLSRATVYELIAKGELRSVRVGRSRRIPLAALDEFVRARESEAARVPA